MRIEEFIMRRFMLPSGRSIVVVYAGKSMENLKPIIPGQPMDDYVEEFIEALDLDLIEPDDFKS